MDGRTGPVPRHHVAWRALLAAHARLTTAVGTALKAADVLSLEAYDVLVALAQAGGRLRLSELAEDVLLTKSGLTRSVDRLEAAGLLRREACKTDRRVVYAVLTRKGSAALERAWTVYAAEVDRRIGAVLTPAEAETLRDLLDRVGAAALPPRGLSARGCGPAEHPEEHTADRPR